MSWELALGLIGAAATVATAVFWLGHWRGRSRTRTDQVQRGSETLDERLRILEREGLPQRVAHLEEQQDRLWDYVRSIVERELRDGGAVRLGGGRRGDVDHD